MSDSDEAALLEQLSGALAHHRLGGLVAAEAGYRGVLAQAPAQPQALHLLGVLLTDTGRPAQARDVLLRAAALRPGNAAVMRALALSLLQTGQANDAAAMAEAALAHDLRHAGAWFVHGAALRVLGKTDAAIASLEQAIALAPDDARCWAVLGNAHADADRLEVAIDLLSHAVALDPSVAEAHVSLGFALTAAGRLREAIAACDAAVALDPGLAVAYWNRAVARLLAGDFAGGWRDAEWRKRHPAFAADFAPLTAPEWTGGPIAGATLLVHAGQGMGDTIQFARYLPLLVARGARVILACASALVPLLRQIPGITVVRRADGLPAHDCWIDQMSLPLIFATRPDTVPAPDGYLAADPRRAAAWRRGRGAAIRVGLVWAGSAEHANDRRRSLPPGQAAMLLAPLRQAACAIPRLRFVGLQVGPRQDELAHAFGMPNIAADLTDFGETAAVIDTLDLVIAVDTATAHLAGAMGKPVWLMLPHAPDWRWQTVRRDTPWYTAMRLFRQPSPGDWAGVISLVAAALRARYVARPNACVASMARVAELAVTTMPQAMSTTDTVTDQPRRVARLVRSYVP